MQIPYVFTAFPHIHNKWCLHGVGRVMLLTTYLCNIFTCCNKSNHFYQSKRWKKQAPAAKLINSSFLPTFTAKSFPPMVIMLLFVQQQLLHRRSRRHCSFCQCQLVMGGAHLMPLGMDSQIGSLGRNVWLPFQGQKRSQALIFQWSKPENWQITQGRQKKYCFVTTWLHNSPVSLYVQTHQLLLYSKAVI